MRTFYEVINELNCSLNATVVIVSLDMGIGRTGHKKLWLLVVVFD